ncbi:MAG TPA: flagellar hook-basal body complex protein FliE [Polyangiaceae bacterium]|nr:flagellar hook-basal body complex protein FliE [Polyangiaceae bacterium]
MIVDGPTLPLALPHVTPEAPVAPAGSEPKSGAAGASFGATLAAALEQPNADMNAASAAGEAFASGAKDDIHGTMLALSKADIELRFASNVRNKVIDAFYELWRMQI